MKLRATMVLVFAGVAACGESYEAPAGAPRSCSGGDPIAVATPASAQDFSALDPARCPAVVPENLRGAQPSVPLLMPDSAIEAKAFYVLTLLDVVSGARIAVSNWPALATLAAERTQA